MARKKSVLSIDNEPDYFLAGVSCHQKDYRFVWSLNKALDCSFERVEDYEIITQDGNTASYMAYMWEEEEGHYAFHVINNHCEYGKFIPEHRGADYLIVITGMYDQLDLTEIMGKIKEISGVLAAFEIDPIKTKSTKNLILE